MSISVSRAMEGLTLKSTPASKTGPKIRVAIDFGTTHSAIAWTHTGDPTRRTHLIQTWPGCDNAPKVPTTLKYTNSDRTKYKWGFEIHENEKRYEWFKLGLDPGAVRQSKLAEKYPSNTALEPVSSAEYEKLVVDYLTALRKHGDDCLRGNIFVGDIMLRTTPREYIITVPAIWSDKAKDKTRSCAEKAGMGDQKTVQIVSEPEAAGVFALDYMNGLGLQVGDTFVICDAGGGTVDLVTYTIDSLDATTGIRISEEVPGDGGLCGSIFLNRIFAKWLEDKFRYFDEWDEFSQADAMDRFENRTKRDFGQDNEDTYLIPAGRLGTIRRLDIQENLLLISKETMKGIFEPVIEEILPLVNAQIHAAQASKRKVKAVLLVGGFGPNKYLRKRIKDAVGNKIAVEKTDESETVSDAQRAKLFPINQDGFMEGRCINHPRTTFAIVRGALLADTVNQRKARKHYGVSRLVLFDEKKHDRSKREKDPFTGKYKIELIHWFVEKGSELKNKKTYDCDVGFYYEQPVQDWLDSSQIMEATIYSCNDKQPPIPSDKTSKGVTELVKLKADLRGMDTADLQIVCGEDGEDCYKINFNIEMGVNSADMTFVLVHLIPRAGREPDRKRYPQTITKEFI